MRLFREKDKPLRRCTSKRFSVVGYRVYNVIDNTDGEQAEGDFETRAAAEQWVREYETRTGRFAGQRQT